jgi:glycogen debranching enzyme
LETTDIDISKLFCKEGNGFLKLTEQFADEGINPGGYYKAVWARDASYILKDWFLTGRFEQVMQEILFIWSHQIAKDNEKIIFGRGSPDMQYISRLADEETLRTFEGALPTTIFHGFSEVYGKNPDIDSTALMVSTTSWILDNFLKAHLMSAPSVTRSHTDGELMAASVVSDLSVVLDFVIPKMLHATDYLSRRDIDGDGLLEQGHNEDWMDTVLRSGKIVYSQACWILALRHFSSLLLEMGRSNEANKLLALASNTIHSVEEKLWLPSGTYADLLDDPVNGNDMVLTQDVLLYLVAISENLNVYDKQNDYEHRNSMMLELLQERLGAVSMSRAQSTLDIIRKRIWKNNGWPVVTERPLEKTGPWILNPNQYHNHTLWPWNVGIELLARGRFGRIEECNQLLSILFKKDSQSQIRALYEWVDPINDKGEGAYPFRTGISAIRIAIIELVQLEAKRAY